MGEGVRVDSAAPARDGTTPARARRHDIALIVAMALVAACGLVYEYLMAHYAGRVLGAVEPTLYAMIGLMIVAMGVGAFAARWVPSVYRGFAWLELAIATLGATSALLMSAVVALAYSLPEWLRAVYGLDASIAIEGGVAKTLTAASRLLPFLAGFAIGLLIGMEVPLIARVREHVHGRRLPHNFGTIYGADYIGAGVGAAVWVLVCLKMPIAYAAVGAAAVNTLVGFAFLVLYRERLRPAGALWAGHIGLACLLVALAAFGPAWMARLGDTLFKDRVVYHLQTERQNIVITKRHVAAHRPDVLSLYLNGALQFASNDERVYHAYLTTPPLLAANRVDSVLILGGGDGLALRDVLRWDVAAVTLIDIDAALLRLFRGADPDAPDWLSRSLTALNEGALNDPRARVVVGDAFIEVERLAGDSARFDVVVADLPDPSHPDLSRLYSDVFFARVRELLHADGAFAIQSTSPYHAKQAFIAIGKTLAHAGFNTEQYRANVPSFGEWGWSIGTVRGAKPSARLAATRAPPPESWLHMAQLRAAFVFPRGFFDAAGEVRVNRLGSHAVYDYHQRAWQHEQGVYYAAEDGHAVEARR